MAFVFINFPVSLFPSPNIVYSFVDLPFPTLVTVYLHDFLSQVSSHYDTRFTHSHFSFFFWFCFCFTSTNTIVSIPYIVYIACGVLRHWGSSLNNSTSSSTLVTLTWSNWRGELLGRACCTTNLRLAAHPAVPHKLNCITCSENVTAFGLVSLRSATNSYYVLRTYFIAPAATIHPDTPS